MDLKNKSILCLNLLGSNLRVDVLDDNLVLVHARETRNRLAKVFGLAAVLQGLWKTEGGGGPHLLSLMAVGTLGDSLLSGKSLLLICGGHFVASRMW